MFKKRLTKKSLLMPLIAPIVIVVLWLGLAGVGGPYFGRIDEVATNDMTSFLPSSAESTQVNSELGRFRDTTTIPAIIVFASDKPLTSAQRASIDASLEAIKGTGLIKGSLSPAIVSDDARAAFAVLPLDVAGGEVKEMLPRLESAVAATSQGLDYRFTGPAAFSRDLSQAFAGIDGILLLVALSVVFVILLIVYRSPILPVVTLLGAMFALSTAILAVWYLAKAGVVQLNGQVQGILFILVIGAATDYALLYIARYREELARFNGQA